MRFTIKKNYFRRICGIVFCLLALYVAGTLSFAAWSDNTEISATKGATELSKNWMAGLDDSLKLSEISLPGTHDSSAYYTPFHYCFQCQDTTIETQLENGFRFLDLRPAMTKDNSTGQTRLCIMHGIGHCRVSGEFGAEYLYFDDVCNTIYQFLDEHPTETVVMMVAAARSSEDVPAVMNMIYDLIAEHPDRWYTKNAIPTLGDARGRIVLSSRYDDPCGVGEELCGLSFDWDSQGMTVFSGDSQYSFALNATESFFVQNHWQVPLDDLWGAFSDTLGNCRADKTTLSINLLSSARRHFLLPTPKENARQLNPKYLALSLKKQNYGVVLFDFGTREMAEHLYETNF